MKVLIATDGSGHAESAANFLAHLPHRDTMDVTVLSTIEHYEVHGSQAVVEWLNENHDREKKRAQDACQRIKSMFAGANARVESIVIEGHPSKTIVDYAKKHNTDLVVLGAVGHSMLERFMIGSTSDFVATHAPCSVLVVRRQDDPKHASRDLNLCVAFDGSEASRKAIARLKDFEWHHHVQFHVVHVMTMPYMFSDIPIAIDTQEIRDASKKMTESSSTDFQGISDRIQFHLLESGHVGDAIVRFADKNQSDIIIMGDTGRSLLDRFFLGSTARYTLRHAPSSVWIVR